ncbi:MAG: hypothetical protein ACRDNN_00555 [Gaiellaceae bacterium]
MNPLRPTTAPKPPANRGQTYQTYGSPRRRARCFPAYDHTRSRSSRLPFGHLLRIFRPSCQSWAL